MKKRTIASIHSNLLITITMNSNIVEQSDLWEVSYHTWTYDTSYTQVKVFRASDEADLVKKILSHEYMRYKDSAHCISINRDKYLFWTWKWHTHRESDEYQSEEDFKDLAEYDFNNLKCVMEEYDYNHVGISYKKLNIIEVSDPIDVPNLEYPKTFEEYLNLI